MTKRIVIIGGGIAGLTAATLLVRAGFQVTILESHAELGGLAKSQILPGGYPTEHSLRAYHYNYTCLLELFKTIPFNDREKLQQQLVPVSFALKYGNDFYFSKQEKNFFKRAFAKYKLIQFLKKQGLQLKDVVLLLKEEVLLRFSWERLLEKMGNMTLGTYVKNASSHYLAIMFASYQTAFIATNKTAALLALELDDSDPFTYLAMANGPASECIINPWENYLISLGVNIKKRAQVIHAQYENKKITKVTLATDEEITGDIFISAVPYRNMIKIAQSASELLNKISALNISNMNIEWGNGAQFFLSSLPNGKVFQPGLIYTPLDSPWKLITVVQGKGMWKNFKLPNECQYVLSITFSDVSKKGILYGKTFPECTRDEILNELIAQCHFDESHLIVKKYLDENIVFINNAEYIKNKDNLSPHLAYQKKDGDWILNFSGYFVPTCENILSAPETRTSVANFYLAGDYCKTAMLISTMEKACESGYRAAQAIAEDYSEKNKIVLPFASYNEKKHRIFRKMDAVLFKIQEILRRK